MGYIEIQNISKKYLNQQNTIALDNINLEINRNELFGVIGPDASGKTTLLKILSTLLLPDSGNIHINEVNILYDYKKIRRLIGYMPETFALYKDLTVEENLIFFANIFGVDFNRGLKNIEQIYSHIEPYKKRKAANLSGGMKQKLSLCCTLIHKPKILFLDEPTTGVDPISRKEFWEILRNIKDNTTIIVSTPYMDEANLCERIALVQYGKLITVGSPKEIINNYPYDLYAAKSINNYQLLLYLKGIPSIINAYISGEYINFNVNKDYNITFDIDISINKIRPTIEDYFIIMMKNEDN